MKIQNNGYVLLLVLVFLQLFAMLSLYGLTSAALMHRLNAENLQRMTLLLAAKKTLHEVEMNLINQTPPCFIEIMGVDELRQQSLDWWKVHGCVIQQRDVIFYVVIEHLGVDVCGVMKKMDDQVTIADYYRMTLYHPSIASREMEIILQSTLAKAQAASLQCSAIPHVVTMGEQMWREL